MEAPTNADRLAGDSGVTGKPACGRYRFGPIRVDAAAHVLSRDGVPQAVEPKAFAVLLALLRRPGELLTHDELLDAVWGHRHVTPGVLTRAIAQLRAALDDTPHSPRYIQTRHALGYCFIGTLEAGPEQVAPTAMPPRPMPPGPMPPGPMPPESLPSGPDAPEPVAAGSGAPGPAVPIDAPRAGNPGPAPAAAAIVRLPRNGPDAGSGADPGSDSGPAPDPAATPAASPPALVQRSPAPYDDRRRTRRLRWTVGALAGLLALALVALWLDGGLLPSRPDQASIAVLPFTSLSSDRDDRYFAEGLSVEMQGALAGVPGLQVAARSSAAAAARRDADVKAIGRLLGVATVLDASVRRDGHRVRIDARLSDTASGFLLWSQRYDRDDADVFAVQSEIAGEVVRALLGVLPAQGDALGRRLAPTRDIGAYDAYLKGLQQLQDTSGEAQLQGAVDSFRQALAADAGFARAQAGICRAEIKRFEYARDAPAFMRAQTACMRASRMDPQLREVSLALGEMHRVRGEDEQAVAQYTRALDDIALRPAAYIGLGRTMDAQGRGDLALKYFERARRLRPGDATAYREIGYHQYLAGDLDAAIDAFRTATVLLPDDADLWASLGGLYLAHGEIDHAAAAFQRSLTLDPGYGALSNFGTLRYEQRDYADAADLYRRAADLEPGDFRIWGNLGDALSASPATATQAREPYRRAADLAAGYVDVRGDDAQALALLAWYRANLGETELAVQRLRQAAELAGDSAEVAFFNAQTLALLGDADGARRWLAQARGAGIPVQRVRASPPLRRLLDGEAGHGGAS